MLLFLFIVLPLSLVVYYLFNKERKFFCPMLVGALCAVLLCAFKVFFTYSHRLIPVSFSENFAYYLLNQSGAPLCGVSLIYFLITKDSLENKINAFFPLISAFYAVYQQDQNESVWNPRLCCRFLRLYRPGQNQVQLLHLYRRNRYKEYI